MAEANKPCPFCGTPLTFRLGDYECASCGHSEAGPSAASSASQSEDRATEYGGVHRAKLLIPSPPPGEMGLGGSLYSSQRSWESSYATAPEPYAADRLQREKMIYMGVEAVLVLFGAIGAAVPEPGSSLSGAAGFFAGLGGGALDMLILWLVLFGSVDWLKWTCLSCTALTVLGNLVSALILIPILMTALSGSTPGSVAFGGLAAGLIYTIIFAVLALRIWLVWILWRDLHSGID